MTDEELSAFEARIMQGVDVTMADIQRLFAEVRRARAELALLRPAGTAVLEYDASAEGYWVLLGEVAEALTAAGWTGGDTK